MSPEEKLARVQEILQKAKLLACEYYELVNKPLGIAGEVAEFEAYAKLEDLKLVEARVKGIDGIWKRNGVDERVQIKGRAVDSKKKYKGKISKIRLDEEFDSVLLVLMDKRTLDPIEMWRADFDAVKERLDRKGSKARNERRQLAISQFKSIAKRVWPI